MRVKARKLVDSTSSWTSHHDAAECKRVSQPLSDESVSVCKCLSLPRSFRRFFMKCLSHTFAGGHERQRVSGGSVQLSVKFVLNSKLNAWTTKRDLWVTQAAGWGEAWRWRWTTNKTRIFGLMTWNQKNGEKRKFKCVILRLMFPVLSNYTREKHSMMEARCCHPRKKN